LKLHANPDAFSAMLDLVNKSTGIRLDVLEKDYYVTLMLKELSEWQAELPVYFKGGTALYKALGSIRRLSEDIDLTVCIDGCSNSQAKRRLEKAANGYLCLPRSTKKELESNQRGAITSLYDYLSASGDFVSDPLQRFGHVKVEATSFTVSEPFAPLLIAPLVYDRANETQAKILRDEFGIAPFFVNTIRLERIFVDKVFASEFYYQRNTYFDVSKHIYDLSVMLRLDSIQTLLSNPAELTAIIAFKRHEEKARIGSDLSEKPISAFEVFNETHHDVNLRKEFELMQDVYVFEKTDRLNFDAVLESLAAIIGVLSKLGLHI
jgi:hypothetical protein